MRFLSDIRLSFYSGSELAINASPSVKLTMQALLYSTILLEYVYFTLQVIALSLHLHVFIYENVPYSSVFKNRVDKLIRP